MTARSPRPARDAVRHQKREERCREATVSELKNLRPVPQSYQVL